MVQELVHISVRLNPNEVSKTPLCYSVRGSWTPFRYFITPSPRLLF